MFESLVYTIFQTNICRLRPYMYFSSYACKHFQSGNLLVKLYFITTLHKWKGIGATLETYVTLGLPNICLKYGIHWVFKYKSTWQKQKEIFCKWHCYRRQRSRDHPLRLYLSSTSRNSLFSYSHTLRLQALKTSPDNKPLVCGVLGKVLQI